jgi:hypothetical protein
MSWLPRLEAALRRSRACKRSACAVGGAPEARTLVWSRSLKAEGVEDSAGAHGLPAGPDPVYLTCKESISCLLEALANVTGAAAVPSAAAARGGVGVCSIAGSRTPVVCFGGGKRGKAPQHARTTRETAAAPYQSPLRPPQRSHGTRAHTHTHTHARWRGRVGDGLRLKKKTKGADERRGKCRVGCRVMIFECRRLPPMLKAKQIPSQSNRSLITINYIKTPTNETPTPPTIS